MALPSNASVHLGRANLFLAVAAYFCADHDRAREHLAESVRRFAEVGHWNGLAAALEGFAALAMVDEDALRAIRLCAAAAALRERLAAPLQGSWQERRTRFIVEPARAAAAERAEQVWALGTRLSVDEAVSYALNGTMKEPSGRRPRAPTCPHGGS